MIRKRVFIVWYLALVFLLLHSGSFRANVVAEETGQEYLKGCTHLRCDNGGQCIKRRYWCKNPPCPGMLYCSKSMQESLKGPSTCDSVRCSSGHICVVRVRGCRWDEKCQQQIARCISEKEYHEGAASCVDFECSPGKRCILRESRCVNPPCKLIRSCAAAKDVQVWFDKCKALDCLSEYECFLRRPDDDCRADTLCAHTPDCTLTAEDELISKHCRGWICPRMQKCAVRIVGSCRGFDCTIERTCRPLIVSSNSSAGHKTFAINKTEAWSTERNLVQMKTEQVFEDAERRGMNTATRYPITRKKLNALKLDGDFILQFILQTTSIAASTTKQTDYTTSQKHGTEISVIHQQTTTVSSSIVKPPYLSSTQPHSTLTYPRSWLNPDELLTTSTISGGLEIRDKDDKILATSSTFSDWPRDSSFPAISFTDRKVESTTSRDTAGLEMPKKIYIATDNAMLPLPVVLEGINLFGQGYPIWIENESHRSMLLGAEDEDENRWRYHAPGEPYRILLPPYEPVILVESAKQGQLSSFVTYALGYPFNEATLLSLQEIPSRDTTGNSKRTNRPMSVLGGDNGDTNVSATDEMRNLKTNHFDDSPGDYASLRATKRTDVVPPNIRDKESDKNHYDDYEWRPWRVNHDYLERSESHPAYEREFTSDTDEIATDDSRLNNSDNITLSRAILGEETQYETHTSTDAKRPLVRGEITDENRGRVFDTRYAYRHDQNLATFDPIRDYVPVGRSDYGPEDDEERYGLVNYPYDTTNVPDVDRSSERRGYPLNKIFDISRNQESATFSIGELDEWSSERPSLAFLRGTSPYRKYNDNNEKNDDREYDEYYSHES
ncbi:uncharacterized protein LOC105183478 [Harpegnathos saltator]|uniref:uncharacterized protein LOC105183478 n=1 Tax=Harpegnathos saltator TaxID=610380 RepID=UPI000DBEEDC4|nr:uncharacterized protein LOC105183478 [Harpegnathos saltator]